MVLGCGWELYCGAVVMSCGVNICCRPVLLKSGVELWFKPFIYEARESSLVLEGFLTAQFLKKLYIFMKPFVMI